MVIDHVADKDAGFVDVIDMDAGGYGALARLGHKHPGGVARGLRPYHCLIVSNSLSFLPGRRSVEINNNNAEFDNVIHIYLFFNFLQ